MATPNLSQSVIDAGVAALANDYGARAGLYNRWFVHEAPRAVALIYEAMSRAENELKLAERTLEANEEVLNTERLRVWRSRQRYAEEE
tara:strand:- start:1260 stop:1523 length:264 start_codon:yes stop_codon:yes gene_type:complete